MIVCGYCRSPLRLRSKKSEAGTGPLDRDDTEEEDDSQHNITCRGCGREEYCSTACRDSAWEWYHNKLCIGGRREEGGGAYCDDSDPLYILYRACGHVNGEKETEEQKEEEEEKRGMSCSSGSGMLGMICRMVACTLSQLDKGLSCQQVVIK